jgi:hypothetical protein
VISNEITRCIHVELQPDAEQVLKARDSPRRKRVSRKEKIGPQGAQRRRQECQENTFFFAPFASPSRCLRFSFLNTHYLILNTPFFSVQRRISVVPFIAYS